ncbi:MAG TPA: hypothetical protein GXZ90_06925 [Clostridiales bacterium]|nr:hypothetical protein [Clostridiales bacterium]
MEYTTRNNNFKCFFKVISFVLIVAFSILININQVSANGGIKLYDYESKKHYTYTGKPVKATFDGKKVTKDKTPGIIINNTSMVSYNDVFVKSGIKATRDYNKAKKTVTLTKNGNTIVLTIGKNTALLNGKTIKLPTAPTKLKYKDSDVVNIMVPATVVSESLGYAYKWDNSSVTSIITSKNQKTAKSSISLSFDGSDIFEYTGAKANAYYKNKKINLTTMPSIINNNTAMLRASKIFGTTIGAEYNYNKASKEVSLKFDDNHLIMTIGNQTGLLNGKSINLGAAPMIIKNHDTNTSYVFVPGRITANSLGLSYEWNASNLSSYISEYIIEPELGDEAITREPGTVLYNWKSNDSSEELKLNNAGISTIYHVSLDESISNNNTERFVIKSESLFGVVESNEVNNSIIINANNMYIGSQVYNASTLSSKFVDSIITSYDNATYSSEITINKNNSFAYEIELSEDRRSLYVTLYKNKVDEIEIGTTNIDDYISITGIDLENLILTKDNLLLTINLPNTYNNLNDINQQITNSKYINGIFTFNNDNNKTYVVSLNEDFNYYTLPEKGKVTIIINNKTNNLVNLNLPGTTLLTFPLPTSIDENNITDEDLYLNNKFIIRIPGNHLDFYNINKINNTANKVTKIDVVLNSNNQTEIIFHTSAIQGYKYAVKDGKFNIAIGDPKKVFKNIVVLDPGHGGGASGATRSGILEKDIALKMLYTFGSKHFDSKNSNIKAYYTRVKDNDISLGDRAKFASKVGADMFVSLHMNSTVSQVTTATGTEVYYSSNNNSKNYAGLNSSTLAKICLDNITNQFGLKSRGILPQRYTVVHNNTVPAVLIELAFMSNPNDLKKMTNETFQKQVAAELYNTLSEVFELYPTGR